MNTNQSILRHSYKGKNRLKNMLHQEIYRNHKDVNSSPNISNMSDLAESYHKLGVYYRKHSNLSKSNMYLKKAQIIKKNLEILH